MMNDLQAFRASTVCLVLLCASLLLLSIPSNSYAAPSITAVQIDQYLEQRSSPLAGYGDTFVRAGRQYGVDPRLIVAIAGAESTFGRNGDCASQRYNAWGYGGGWPRCSSFSSWDRGIQAVAWQIGAGAFYFTEGRDTISEIGSKWCASGCEHWEQNVTEFYTALGGDTSNLRFVEPNNSLIDGKASSALTDNGRVVNSNRLNVRSGPGTGYSVLGRLGRNQVVEIVARNANGTWYQIRHDAGTNSLAWVSASYIETSATGLPVANPSSTNTGTSSRPTTSSGQSINSGGMNMNQYCQSRGFDSAALGENTAYGWYCRSQDGRTAGMNLEALCQQQHGAGYKPEYSNFNDPYSWRCVRSSGTSSSGSSSSSANTQPQPQPSTHTVVRYQVEALELRCGDGGIIALGLTPMDDRRLRIMLTKCPDTRHAGKFTSDGIYEVLIDGRSRYVFNYTSGNSMFFEYIDPYGDGIQGGHNYQIRLYPAGQQEPIWSGVHRAWTVDVQE